MDQKQIGAFIAKKRKSKNMTQAQLASQLNVTYQAVSKWENGRGLPDVSLLQPLCDALGITINDLFQSENKINETRRLKSIKSVFSICARMTLLIAIIEFIIGLVSSVFHPDILKPMLINALVWTLLFLVSISIVIFHKQKLLKLKREGTQAEAKIIEIIPANWIRITNYATCQLLCEFTYQEKRYEVKSHLVVINPFKRKEDLHARIYFDQTDAAKYSVELFQSN